MADAAQKLRFLIRGRVQGVFYRASTQTEAIRLGLDGWAMNLSDGSVEVVASGPESAVAALGDWLWRGPPGARVTSVSVSPYDAKIEPGFSTA